jgi:excisionase family DNA binding protein
VIAGGGADPRLELLTIPATAAELGIHANTAYRLVKAGSPRFPTAIRVGSQWRVPRFQLDRFIAGGADLSESVAS